MVIPCFLLAFPALSIHVITHVINLEQSGLINASYSSLSVRFYSQRFHMWTMYCTYIRNLLCSQLFGIFQLLYITLSNQKGCHFQWQKCCTLTRIKPKTFLF